MICAKVLAIGPEKRKAVFSEEADFASEGIALMLGGEFLQSCFGNKIVLSRTCNVQYLYRHIYGLYLFL